MSRDRSIPNVLSIAGSDPGGGAGIQADLKTFAARGCHGMAAITALTAQNTTGVSVVHLPPADFVAEQIRMIFADIAVSAVKIGMLGTQAIVESVAEALAAHKGIPIVLDPVLVATSGAALGDDSVITAMRTHLFPLATIVTPNLAEAARLLQQPSLRTSAKQPRGGRTEALAPGSLRFASNDGIDADYKGSARLISDGLTTNEAIEAAARHLRGSNSAAWLVKGGHGSGRTADDLLLDGEGALWLSSPRLKTRNTHGTGCTLSSAIAAHLASGMPLRAAVAQAKAYLDRALGGADRLDVGHGPGPVDHFADWRKD